MQRPRLTWIRALICLGLLSIGATTARTQTICLLNEAQIIFPPELLYAHQFGSTMASDGQRVAVSAPATYPSAGARAVFILERGEQGTWFIADTLQPNLGPAINAGISVAIDGDLLAIGRWWPDAARIYIYKRDKDSWQLIQTIFPPPGTDTGLFGDTVVLANGRLLAALSGDSVNGYLTGAIAVYRTNAAGSFVFSEMLRLDDAQPWDYFGNIMSLDADTLACGIRNREAGGLLRAGRVVVFHDTGTSFVRTATIASPEP